MQSDLITCSIVVDRNVYNAYKSIISKKGENVKGNIVKYMQAVIKYDTSDADTILAIQEVEALKANPDKRVYSSFDEAVRELEDDE